jgi:serine/threonine-protein kinase
VEKEKEEWEKAAKEKDRRRLEVAKAAGYESVAEWEAAKEEERRRLKKWSFATGGWVLSSPALSPDGSTVFVGSVDHSVYALSAADGSEKWSFATGNRWSSVCCARGAPGAARCRMW